MDKQAHTQTKTDVKKPADISPAPASLLLRKCACGGTASLGGDCAECRRNQLTGGRSLLQAKLSVNAPGDRWEQEADRAAEAVVSGNPVIPISGNLTRSSVQREENEKKPAESEKYKEAAGKVGEAFLETEVGKKIKESALEHGEAFISTLPGKAITGTAAAGAVAAIIATNSELPLQVPEIPLDQLTPGLKMKITYEGPVQKPTKAMISFTYTFGGPKSEKKQPEPSESEKYRAETARMAAEQRQFREGLKNPAQREKEKKEFWDSYWRMQSKDPLNPLNLPGLKPKKEEESLLMRKAADSSPLQLESSDHSQRVTEVLGEQGQPLEPETRRFMQSRLGHDFSQVRVHINDLAAKSAQAVRARAFTLGRDIVFASGEYRPEETDGQRLIAHELVHVIQQTGLARRSGEEEFPITEETHPAEGEADRNAGLAMEGRVPLGLSTPAMTRLAIQRQAASFDAIPTSSLRAIVVSTLAADVPAERITAFFRLLPNRTVPGETENPPGQVTFQSGIPQNLQRGLQSVGGYLTNRTNNLPENSTINVALDLTAHGGANTVYRFTRYSETSGRTATNHFLIEEVGAATAAPAAVTATAGAFTVGGQSFNLVGTWSDANFALLRQALGMLPAAALTAAAGLSFQYRSSAGTGSEAGEYDREHDRVILFSNAFPSASVRYGTSVTATRNILHEIGHALDLRPLESAWQQFTSAGQPSSGRGDFLASRSLSGSRYVSRGGQYESDVNIDASRDGTFRQAARSDGVRRDSSGRMIDLGGGVQEQAGISGGATRYSDINYEELFAESFAIYTTDPDRLRLLRPNIYQYFLGRYPLTP